MIAKPQTCNWDSLFAAVRTLASNPALKHLVFVRRNQSMFALACPETSAVRPEYIAEVSRIVPADTRRQIAVLAPTQPKIEASDMDAIAGTADILGLRRTIPFIGMLIGLVTVGHTVWVFDGQPEAMTAGCYEADVLLIDSFLATALTTKMLDSVLPVMRNPNILIFDRKCSGIRVYKSAGQPTGPLAFREAAVPVC